MKSLFIKFMNSIQCPIKDINTKFEITKMTPELLPPNMPTQLKELITHSNVQEARLIEAKLDYGMFSVDLKKFEKNLDKVVAGTKLINNNSEEFDTVISVKNKGYSSKKFRTVITVDNKKDKVYETYYVVGNYEYKSWDIYIGNPGEKPDEWELIYNGGIGNE